MATLLITGANRGIGFCLARVALERGWRVLGSARTHAQAEETAAVLGAGFTPLVFDVTDRDGLRRAAAARGEAIDVLINNAGIIGPKPEDQSTLHMDFDGFLETLAVNTLAPLAVAQAFLPHLRRAPGARILTVSSQMAYMGYAKSDRIAYRASKAAVNKVMQGLATDLAAEAIAVGLVDPGWVQTDMGGPEAELAPATVATGILDLAEGLDMSRTGRFFKWTGEERPF
ncbi:SDR family NAD(P)-dependent oxidoreductase [Polymorphum gilvum]|uniref:Short-chain dehydrogenase/reductase SDR n=1 Tax=Polymorphum gilvum (strain LMG 25793 / CGMCC 1.9160 / SL003B-26A1) TaxID=991905 RepID=F2J5Y3_POLGS|nr:SDR family NAD(P)-dependent oxidoreductase [Polymorphum gilvum]ADZ71237.1 Short-chain dehydrogenase/reductase SDR [Polymorphum gilvum SL003B-26A1]